MNIDIYIYIYKYIYPFLLAVIVLAVIIGFPVLRPPRENGCCSFRDLYMKTPLNLFSPWLFFKFLNKNDRKSSNLFAVQFVKPPGRCPFGSFLFKKSMEIIKNMILKNCLSPLARDFFYFFDRYDGKSSKICFFLNCFSPWYETFADAGDGVGAGGK